MKVLLVHPFRLGTAGLTTFVLRLQDGLRAKGCNALVLVAGDSTRVVSLPGQEDIFAIYFRRLWPEGARLKGLLAFWAVLPATLWHLRRFLRRERIDVVHLHFLMPAALYFVVLRPFGRWKLVATFHGTDGYALRKRSMWHRLLVRLAASSLDCVTTVSFDLLKTVLATLPRLRAKARVIRNGNPVLQALSEAPVSSPLPSLPNPYILAVGSLIPRKAYDLLVRAVGIIRDCGYYVNLVIVGDGPEAPRLAALARELEVEERIVFAGDLAHVETLRFYPGAKFFVHSAREEAFGLVLLEAMAFGKAVIAPRVGGIPEFIRHGETGLLVTPDDPAELATAIIQLNGDERLCDSLAARGHEVATSDYSWERVVDSYWIMYSELLHDITHMGQGAEAMPPSR